MPSILELEHVQLDIPAGGESVARDFYGRTLGLREIYKPAGLSPTGVWFAVGNDELHLGVAGEPRAAQRAHAAIRVIGLAEIASRCGAAGHQVEHDGRYPGRSRFYVRDPFGNRLELFERDGDAEFALQGEQPTLRTDRLTLRPFQPGDAPVVERLAGEFAVADMTASIRHPYPPGGAERWIAKRAEQWSAAQQVSFAIVDRALEELVGYIGLFLVPRHSRASIGYWIGVPYWGAGYATEAAHAVIDFAFGALALHRVDATYLTRNAASGRVLEKLGMRLEGVHRGESKKRDGFEDISHCAMLASDPR
jgi:RimJ/RimL family protein N-acetyltransferase